MLFAFQGNSWLEVVATMATSAVTVGLPLLVSVRRLDKRNTKQHNEGKEDRIQSQQVILSRLDEVHLDVMTTNMNVGKIDGKLDAHLEAHRNWTV